MTDQNPKHEKDQPGTARLRTAEDILAWTPYLLQRQPRDCLVVLGLSDDDTSSTIGSTAEFAVPTELTPGEALEAQIAHLAGMLRNDRCREAILIAYTDDVAGTGRARAAIGRAFSASGIDLLRAMRTDGEYRWDLTTTDPSGERSPAVPCDLRHHPAHAQADMLGLRERLEENIKRTPLPRPPAGMADAIEKAEHGLAEDTDRDHVGETDASIRRINDFLRNRTPDAVPESNDQLAALIVALQGRDVRASLVARLDRTTAAKDAAAFRRLAESAPPPYNTAPLGLLALSAWLHDDRRVSAEASKLALNNDPTDPVAGLSMLLLSLDADPREWAGLRNEADKRARLAGMPPITPDPAEATPDPDTASRGIENPPEQPRRQSPNSGQGEHHAR